uniref:RanBD1 domain-containing protein n=1 Tax=Glossina austeni TaxID=7395 RepID=A0A1A9VEI3_GLOAU
NLALVRARYFNGLNFSTQNLNFCGAESLNQLDVDSFMYAAAIQAKRVVDVEREISDNYNSEKNNSAGKPRILPFVNMQSQLCTDEQAQWWDAAYRVYKNLRYGCDLTDLKVTLQYGIEAVRGINGPKVDLNIMFKLGQIFVVRAQATERPVDKSLLEARSESIYRTALNMLKMRRGGVLEPFDKHFKYARAESTAIERELNNAAEDAVTYVANRYFKRLEYEDLIEELAGLQLPFASYWQAEAYLKLDEIKKTSKKTSRLNVERAAECLNHTLALLKSSSYVDTKHALNTIIHHRIRKIKQMSASLVDDSLMDIYCSPHNSSSYEDAENDVYQDSFTTPAYSQGNLSRVRREITGTASFTATAHNQEMENMVKQMASTLILLKEEVLENLIPELQTVAKEVVSMKDRIGNLEETMKKSRVSSIPPSRDDASKVLDDFYIIEDALRQQLYQQPQTAVTTAPAFMSSNQCSAATDGLITNSPFLGQQPRLQTPTPMHLPPNAFNNTMFPPNAANYPLNFYSHNQPNPINQPNPYLTQAQGGQQGSIQVNQRNVQLSLPYTQPPISGGLNFNTTPILNSQLVEKGPPANVVKVKTGEEDEEILYVHRAKLYRFTDGEWKERGIGNVKILRHKESKKLRVIMRRDQVLKICLNHNLNEDVDYKRKDHKSWLFVVNDFSEEAIELQKLSLRFKNKEIADKFMETVIKALDGTASPVIERVGSNTSLNTSASLGLPSTALNITEENEKLAIDLKLPLNFFESVKPDCVGCRGCDPEKFTFTHDGNNEIFINEEDTKSPLLPTELPPLVLLKQSTLSPIISTATTTLITTPPSASINFKKKLVNTFNANTNNSKESADEATPTSATNLSQENPKTCSIIKPGNIFGGFTEMENVGEESIFSGVANSTSTAADKTQSISIFGGTGTSLSGGSIFGQKPPIFGNSSSIFGDTTKSIFGSSNNNSKGGSINTSIFGSSYTSFTGFSSNKPTTAGRSVFGSAETPTTTTAQVGSSLNEAFATTTNTGSEAAGSFMDLSKTSTAAIDFASLAAQAPKDDKAVPALAKGNEKPAPGNFIGLTGQNAFASFAKPLTEQKSNDKNMSKGEGLNDTKNNQSGECGAAGNNSTDENYDPHYEPIIALPEEIVITTGEEEETKLFGERANLFRWDDTNKEWKERGVGELKILFHPIKQTYRMLMRREQIYKLILNQVVNSDFSFSEMNKNPKSFLWGAMNYAECPEGVLEKLAVRFKNVKLAEQFREQLNKCIAADQNRDN